MKKDITGRRFGRLIAVEATDRRYRGSIVWSCLCDCGTVVSVNGCNLRSGASLSCGCLQKELAAKLGAKLLFVHGMCQSREHNTWASMIQRCTNKNATSYANYGGRGINVCERWLKFPEFYADMGDRPAGMSIDRIDNDLGYFLGNCKWSGRSEQERNKRVSKNNKTGTTGVEWYGPRKNIVLELRSAASVFILAFLLIYKTRSKREKLENVNTGINNKGDYYAGR